MKSYKYVFFDADGTLFDSKDGIIASVRHTMEQLGLGEATDKELECFVGPPLKKTFESFFGIADASDAVKIFRKYYAESQLLNVKIYGGIELLLKNLRRNYTLFVASSKPTVFVEKIADNFGISSYFTDIVGSNIDNTRSKKSEVIDYILKKYRIAPGMALMIGDKSQDIVGASECGVDSIGVLYGYGSRAEFEKCDPKPVYIAKAPADIADFLD